MSIPAKSTLEHSRSIAVSPGRQQALTGVAGAVLFAGLTFVGAHISIPLQPVPITLQTLFVLLSGAIVGTRYGLLAQSLYVGLGAAGLPFFAGGAAGFSVFVGPTGGYLMGFLLAPIFVGRLIALRREFWWQIMVFIGGSFVVLSLGVTYLTVFYTHDLLGSLQVGYLPFIPGDIFKIIAAASIYRSFRAIHSSRV